MIVITVELWPHGDKDRKQDLGTMVIANNLSQSTAGNDSEFGAYDVVIFKGKKYSKAGGVWKKTKLKDFPRLRLGPWDLIYRALRTLVGGRNKSASKYRKAA